MLTNKQKIKWIRQKKKFKNARRNLANKWYKLMEPLANVLDERNKAKYAKFKEKCVKISDEELIERFAKYLIWKLTNRELIKQEEFILFKGQPYRRFNGEFEERILKEIKEIDSNYKDKWLRGWSYHNPKSRLVYVREDGKKSKQATEYERKLNLMLKEELDKLGDYVEVYYVDIREVREFGKYGKYDTYESWLEKIDYESTLIVKVKK